MITIALRFGEHFAPDIGTIAAHEQLIKELGHVWYGKMGSRVSQKMCDEIKNNKNAKILLIRSGKTERYWAFIEDVQEKLPPITEIPEYYRDVAGTFKTWFKVSKFERADKNVMSQWIVTSSKNTLADVSRHSMSPYFIITDEK